MVCPTSCRIWFDSFGLEILVGRNKRHILPNYDRARVGAGKVAPAERSQWNALCDGQKFTSINLFNWPKFHVWPLNSTTLKGSSDPDLSPLKAPLRRQCEISSTCVPVGTDANAPDNNFNQITRVGKTFSSRENQTTETESESDSLWQELIVIYVLHLSEPVIPPPFYTFIHFLGLYCLL